MAFEGENEQPLGSLYKFNTKKEISRKVEKIYISNGLAWSQDSTTMFYIDSIPKKLYAFNYDKQSADICKKSYFF